MSKELELKSEVERLKQELREAKFNADNWQNCSEMVRDTLIGLGCKCGAESHEATPPMMYPEWIHCVVRSRVEEYKAILDKLPQGADEQPLYLYREGFIYAHYNNVLCDEIIKIGIVGMVEGEHPYCQCTVRDIGGHEWDVADDEIFDSIETVKIYRTAMINARIKDTEIDKVEFKECDVCASKSGSPLLCSVCLHNRELISKLVSQLKEG